MVLSRFVGPGYLTFDCTEHTKYRWEWDLNWDLGWDTYWIWDSFTADRIAKWRQPRWFDQRSRNKKVGRPCFLLMWLLNYSQLFSSKNFWLLLFRPSAISELFSRKMRLVIDVSTIWGKIGGAYSISSFPVFSLLGLERGWTTWVNIISLKSKN